MSIKSDLGKRVVQNLSRLFGVAMEGLRNHWLHKGSATAYIAFLSLAIVLHFVNGSDAEVSGNIAFFTLLIAILLPASASNDLNE